MPGYWYFVCCCSGSVSGESLRGVSTRLETPAPRSATEVPSISACSEETRPPQSSENPATVTKLRSQLLCLLRREPSLPPQRKRVGTAWTGEPGAKLRKGQAARQPSRRQPITGGRASQRQFPLGVAHR